MQLRPEKKMVLSGAFCMLVANVCFIGWVITRSADWAAWAMVAMLVSLVIPLVHTWIPRGIRHLARKIVAAEAKAPGAPAAPGAEPPAAP